MKTLALSIGLLTYIVSFAQRVVDVKALSTNGIGQNNFYTAGGVPFVNAKFVNLLEGTPYLTENWMRGRVLSKDGRGFSSSMIRLDLLNNQLHFIHNDGRELISNVVAREMWLEDTIDGKNYYLVHSSFFAATTDQSYTWYQLLDSGKVNLYKVCYKVLSETMPYGGATHEQRIQTVAKYFIELESGLVQVKKLKDLPAQLPDKKKEVEAFIKNHEKNISLDEGWIQTMQYYNSIQE